MRLIILVCLIAGLRSQEDNNDIIEMINRMASQYEKVSERSGKFLFLHQYDIHKRNLIGYAPAPYNQIEEEYDFIVIGSGSAGSVVANRLTENPDWKVLLLEVGKEPIFVLDIPAIAAAFQFTDYNWGYLMEKQENLCLGFTDQRMAWPRGRSLGGTSVINYMIYTRGNRHDYDRWEAAGNPGWSYKDVLPYFKKLEDSSLRHEDSAYRSRGGPISVEDVDLRTDSGKAFINSAMEAGHKYVDYNGKRQLGISFVQASTKRGKRCSAEQAYLRPARGRPNLTIMTLSRATKLIINDERRVTGVQYVRNRQYHVAKVRKEVILSAGTFNSPQLLMLSGIGPREHLAELGIPLVQDLPVGQRMYDHSTFLGLIFTVNETSTLDQRWIEDPRSYIQLVANGTGPLTSLGGVEALLYIQTEVSRDAEKYPDMELIFVGGGMHTDNGLVYRKSFRITDEVYNAIWKPLETQQAFQVLPMLIHPYSRGFLKLKSKNPYHWPKLYGNFFTDPEGLDIKTYIAAIREVQRIVKSPSLQRFGVQQVRTPVPGCGHIPFDSDSYWECALRHITGTLHHQVSTCRMGPASDPDAVVDNKLKVYGVKGLRVIDSSIIPIPLSAHTNIPATMIGEKGSDLIKEEWNGVLEGHFDPRDSKNFPI